MFDVVHRETKNVDISVVQQPNDAADAARLYGECERRAKEAAAKAVIQQLGAKNEFRALVCKQEGNFATGETKYRIMFELNSVPYDLETTLEDLHTRVGEVLLNAIFQKLVVQLTAHLKYVKA